MITIREKRKKDDYRYYDITADSFVKYSGCPEDGLYFREVDLIKEKCTRKHGELFVSIEFRDKDGNFPYNLRKAGYVMPGKELSDFLAASTFTGCNGIKMIQWADDWNIVFEEAAIIGDISMRMSNESFEKFLHPQLIIPGSCCDDSDVLNMSYDEYQKHLMATNID